MTNQARVSYVYIIWVSPADPRDYLPTLEFVDPNANIRIAEKFERYTFGINNCTPAKNELYILKSETPPAGNVEYRVETYDTFHVYIPVKLEAKP